MYPDPKKFTLKSEECYLEIPWKELEKVANKKVYLTVMRGEGVEGDEAMGFAIVARSNLTAVKSSYNVPFRGVYKPNSEKSFLIVALQVSPMPYPSFAFKISIDNPA